jgi:hypothetical protein
MPLRTKDNQPDRFKSFVPALSAKASTEESTIGIFS